MYNRLLGNQHFPKSCRKISVGGRVVVTILNSEKKNSEARTIGVFLVLECICPLCSRIVWRTSLNVFLRTSDRRKDRQTDDRP